MNRNGVSSAGGMVLRRRATKDDSKAPIPPPTVRKRVLSCGKASKVSKTSKKSRPSEKEGKESGETSEGNSNNQNLDKPDQEQGLLSGPRRTRRSTISNISNNSNHSNLSNPIPKKSGGGNRRSSTIKKKEVQATNTNLESKESITDSFLKDGPAINGSSHSEKENGETLSEEGLISRKEGECIEMACNGVMPHQAPETEKTVFESAVENERLSPQKESSESTMHLNEESATIHSQEEKCPMAFVPEVLPIIEKDTDRDRPLEKTTGELNSKSDDIDDSQQEKNKEESPSIPSQEECRKEPEVVNDETSTPINTSDKMKEELVEGSIENEVKVTQDTDSQSLEQSTQDLHHHNHNPNAKIVLADAEAFCEKYELEDAILKELEKDSCSTPPVILDESSLQTSADVKSKKARCKRKVMVNSQDQGDVQIEQQVPVKRSLRLKTLSHANALVNTNVKAKVADKSDEGKTKKQIRKPRGRNVKRTTQKKNGSVQSTKSSCKTKSPSDSENNVASDHSSDEPLVPLKGSKALISESIEKEKSMDLKDLEAVKKEINERLKSFEHIKENIFLCERRSNKQSRGMECDCSLTKEEISSNKKGCGENCLNRLLKIECNKLCSLGKLCGNKKFQSSDNAPVEVFKTDCKGFGIRATSNIPGDTFIMEYVGEVLDAKQFRKRAKRYAKDDVRHFYFMALSTEHCIDAGSKGNISRFINHSCSPNSETQKWMVDGEMRIGFFTKRKISYGEEITFDYKYERYGQEAQKCLCEAENCRGWLGGEPLKDEEEDEDEDDLEEDDYWSTSEEESEGEEEPKSTLVSDSLAPPEDTNKIEDEEQKDKDFVLQPSHAISEDDKFPVQVEEGPPKRRRRRRRSPRKIKNYEDVEDEDELEKLKSTGIRTKNHTVELSRIMVRTTDTHSRSILAELLLNADAPCKRLFLDYYGLRILYGWMSENVWNDLRELDLKIQILNILAVLGIPHKTMLVDCKVWPLVNAWADGQFGDETSEENSELHSGSTSPLNGGEEIIVSHIQQSLASSSSPDKKNSPEGEPVTSTPPSNGSSDPMEVVKEECLKTDEKPLDDVVVDSSKAEEKEEEMIIASSKDKDLQKTFSEQPALKEEVFETDIKPITKVECTEEENSSLKTIEEIDERYKVIISKSKELIETWKVLKEVFKIPKKDRIALRAEHEREADQAAASLSSSTPKSAAPSARNTITTIITNNACATVPQNNGNAPSSNGNLQKNSGYFAGRAPEVAPVSSKRLCSRWDDRSGRLHRNKISREERRQLFALQVKQQEEEKKKRELLLEHHRNKCFYLNLPADETPMFPHYPDFVFNPEDGNWYQMPEPYPRVHVTWGYATMAELPSEAYQEGDEPLPDRAYLYPPGVVPVSYLYGIPLTTPEDYYKQIQLQQMVPPPTVDSDGMECQSIQHNIPTDQPIDSSSPNGVGAAKLKRPDDVPQLEESSDNLLNSSQSPTPFSLHKSNELTSEFKHLSDNTEAVGPDIPKKKTELPVDVAKVSTVSSRSETTKTNRPEIIIKLPPKWKTAIDANGQLYFYNIATKCTQWEPPDYVKNDSELEELSEFIEVDTLTTDSEDENGEEDGEESDDDEEEDSDEDASSTAGIAPTHGRAEEITSDLSEKEKEILLNLPKKKTKEERQHERRQKRERDREKREYERKRRRERHGKHRRDGLVQEFFIPRRSDNEKRELMANREAKEKLQNREKQLANEQRLQNNREKGQIIQDKKNSFSNEVAPGSSSGLPLNATSLSTSSLDSEKEKKYKDRFLKETSKVIVKVLDPYRRSDVPCGQIKSVEDFKHLARKLTNFVMTKELKHCPKIEDLKCSESVKKKAAEFVKKYMSKFGDVYKRSPQPGM